MYSHAADIKNQPLHLMNVICLHLSSLRKGCFKLNVKAYEHLPCRCWGIRFYWQVFSSAMHSNLNILTILNSVAFYASALK